MTETTIEIEVAFATAERQEVVRVNLRQGSTIADAVRASGLNNYFPGVDLNALEKGVWNQVKPDDHVLQNGDRVEIYRPLIVDAKTARRNRVQKKKEQQLKRD